MKEKDLLKLLETIAHRRAILKELEKATKALEAKLESEMRLHGMDSISTDDELNAGFYESRSVKAAKMDVLLRTFDPRTMAALLEGVTINKKKQDFLDRVRGGRDYRGATKVDRQSRFTINLPRSAEQKQMIAKAIAADLKQAEKDIEAQIAAYAELEGVAPVADNPAVTEAALNPPKNKGKKKAAKKKAAKKTKKKS